MENLASVNARLVLIYIGDWRRAQAWKGPFWKDVIREHILTARRVRNGKAYYHPPAALD